jgi:hypothetical protein
MTYLLCTLLEAPLSSHAVPDIYVVRALRQVFDLAVPNLRRGRALRTIPGSRAALRSVVHPWPQT